MNAAHTDAVALSCGSYYRMPMRPERLTVYELFQKQKRFVVPLFQRPYVWNEEDQWHPLWEDIENLAEEIRLGKPPIPHFLGAVVLNQIPTFGRQVDASEIIDGQQRLTTLQVFLGAFRDLVEKVDEGAYRELCDLTANRNPPDPDARLKVWPTHADQPVFRQVMTAGSGDAIAEVYPRRAGRRKTALPPLVEAYLYFSSEIAGYLKASDGGVTNRVEALFEAVRRRLQLVIIELEDKHDDPQVIFESLNAHGTPLFASDLVRNFVFLQTSRQNEDQQAIYDRWWREYDQGMGGIDDKTPFWKQEERQGRVKRARIDLFLRHYLSCKTGGDIPVGRLYQEFKKWWLEAKERPVHAELQEMRRYSDAFKDLAEPMTNTRLGNFAQRLKVLDTSTLYPLLLFLLVDRKAGIEPAEFAEILTNLESYLIRRLVCRLSPKNYNHYFLALLGKLRAMPRIDRGTVQKALLESSEPTAVWPDDDAFMRAWCQEPVYLLHKSERIQMVFEAIELQLQTSKQERLLLGQKLTIEHVMPQEWRTHWPAPIPEVGQTQVDAEDRRDRLTHTFGNLTLLTQALNSSVSNGPYGEKRPDIAKQSTLRLNVIFQDQMTWDEMSIQKRSEALFEVARKVWPHPNGKSDRA